MKLATACAGMATETLYFAKLYWDLENRNAAADGDHKKRQCIAGFLWSERTHRFMHVFLFLSDASCTTRQWHMNGKDARGFQLV